MSTNPKENKSTPKVLDSEKKCEVRPAERDMIRFMQETFNDAQFSDVIVQILDADENSETRDLVHFRFRLHRLILSQLDYFKVMLSSWLKESKHSVTDKNGFSCCVINLRLFSEENCMNEYSIFEMFFKHIYAMEISKQQFKENAIRLHSIAYATLYSDLAVLCELEMYSFIDKETAIGILNYVWFYRVDKTLDVNIITIKKALTPGLFAVFMKALQCIKIHLMDPKANMLDNFQDLPYEVISSCILRSPESVMNIHQKKTLIDVYSDHLTTMKEKKDNDKDNKVVFDYEHWNSFEKLKKSFTADYTIISAQEPCPYLFKSTKILEIHKDEVSEFVIQHHYMELKLFFYVTDLVGENSKTKRLNIDFSSRPKVTLKGGERDPEVNIYILSMNETHKYTIPFIKTEERLNIAKTLYKHGFPVRSGWKEFGISVSIKTHSNKANPTTKQTEVKKKRKIQ
jgi:hypothetical protein